MEQFKFAVGLIIAQIFIGVFNYFPKVLCERTASRFKDIKWTREKFSPSISGFFLGGGIVGVGVYFIYISKFSGHGRLLLFILGFGGVWLGGYLIYWFFLSHVIVDGDRVVYRDGLEVTEFHMADIIRVDADWSNILVFLRDGSKIRISIDFRNCGKLLAILRVGCTGR